MNFTFFNNKSFYRLHIICVFVTRTTGFACLRFYRKVAIWKGLYVSMIGSKKVQHISFPSDTLNYSTHFAVNNYQFPVLWLACIENVLCTTHAGPDCTWYFRCVLACVNVTSTGPYFSLGKFVHSLHVQWHFKTSWVIIFHTLKQIIFIFLLYMK